MRPSIAVAFACALISLFYVIMMNAADANPSRSNDGFKLYSVSGRALAATQPITATATPTSTLSMTIPPSDTITQTASITVFVPVVVGYQLANPPVVQSCLPTLSISSDVTAAVAFKTWPDSDSSPLVCANAEEMQLAEMLLTSPLQERKTMNYHPILAKVAREFVQDMSMRGFESAVNPDGFGPNYLVEQAGYALPDYYNQDADANNVGTTLAGYATVDDVFSELMSSPFDDHVWGKVPTYRDQSDYGVGYFFNEESNHKHYWMIIIAMPAN